MPDMPPVAASDAAVSAAAPAASWDFHAHLTARLGFRVILQETLHHLNIDGCLMLIGKLPTELHMLEEQIPFGLFIHHTSIKLDLVEDEIPLLKEEFNLIFFISNPLELH